MEFETVEPAAYLVSNLVEFTVLTPEAGWIATTLREAAAALSAQVPYERQPKVSAALDALCYLGTTEAALTALSHYSELGDRFWFCGLFRDPQPERACALMRNRLEVPEQYIDDRYVATMAEICTRGLSSEAKRQQKDKILRTGITQVVNRGGFPALLSALRFARTRIRDVRREAEYPAAVRQAIRAARKSLPDMEETRRDHLLQDHWDVLRHRSLQPLLESLATDEKNPDLTRMMAIRCLHGLDPARARELLVAELRRFNPFFPEGLPQMLPPPSAPNLDEALLAYVKKWGYGHHADGPRLLALYLSPKQRAWARELYATKPFPCQPELLAYFVRTDPEFAQEILSEVPWEMHSSPPLCWQRYMGKTPQWAMSPVLAGYLAAHLWHESPQVKTLAARSLAEYGPLPARVHLKKAYDYFHQYWKGREQELGDSREGVWLEMTLYRSLATGRAWWVSRTELEQLGRACMSEACSRLSRLHLDFWRQPLTVSIRVDERGLMMGRVAHFRHLIGWRALTAKLKQAPAGTEFVLRVSGPLDPEELAAVRKRVHEWTAGHKLRILDDAGSADAQ